MDGVNWFRCECAPGFAGPDCRISESLGTGRAHEAGVRWAGVQGWKAAAREREPIVSGRQIRKPFRKTVLTSPLCTERGQSWSLSDRSVRSPVALLGESSSEKAPAEPKRYSFKEFKTSVIETFFFKRRETLKREMQHWKKSLYLKNFFSS